MRTRLLKRFRVSEQASRLWLSGLLFILLVGCSYLQPFPNTEEHIVARDESLYAIAWRYERDFRDLAEWNGISEPYKLYPGQRLVLHPFGGGPARRPVVQPASEPEQPSKPSKLSTTPVTSAPVQSTTRVEPSPQPQVRPASPEPTASAETSASTGAGGPPAVASATPGAETPSSTTPATPPPEATAPSPAEPPVTVAKAEPPRAPEPEPQRTLRTRNGWGWPTAGEPAQSYKDTGTGLTIPGKMGQGVYAARDGKVVYAGSGLKGYGLLVIIKHNDEYLTAYGYNDRLLVAQGESVKVGQRIATMGLGPENRSMLHFELRRNGRPVDPMRLLPAPG